MTQLRHILGIIRAYFAAKSRSVAKGPVLCDVPPGTGDGGLFHVLARKRGEHSEGSGAVRRAGVERFGEARHREATWDAA